MTSLREALEQLLLKALFAVILLHASFTLTDLLISVFPSIGTDYWTRLFVATLPALVVMWWWYIRAVNRPESRKQGLAVAYTGIERGFRIGKWVVVGLVIALVDSLVSHDWWTVAVIGFATVAQARFLRQQIPSTEAR